MSASRSLTTMCLGLCCLLLATACRPERPNGPEPTPTPVEDGPLVLGARIDGIFVPYATSGEARFVWGPQGGTMIEPVLSLDPAVAGDEREVEVIFDNSPDPDFESPGELLDFPQAWAYSMLYEEDGRLVTDPLFDQVGWMDPSGVRMRLDATMTGQAFTISAGLALQVVAAPDPFGCNDLPTYGDGCTYRLFEGTVAVTSIAAGSGTPSCDERLDVDFVFTPDDPDWVNCYQGDATGMLTMDNGQSPPSACIEALGIEVGSILPVDYAETAAGMCMPWEWHMDEALAGCETTCP